MVAWPLSQFKDCGKLATESVQVGEQICHYCAEHAEQAREFVRQQGQARIAQIQKLNTKE